MDVPPEQAYELLGFHPHQEGRFLEADLWRKVQSPRLLQDMLSRYELQQEYAGCPLVDHGFVVGKVPELRLDADHLARLRSALQEALAAGCRTIEEWQQHKLSNSSA